MDEPEVSYLGLDVAGEHVGHLPRVEDVVDVLNKGLVLDLRIAEEEHSGFTVATCLLQKALEVLAPLRTPVALGDFDLPVNICCLFWLLHALLTALPNAHATGVACRESNHHWSRLHV
jgi:hypothetical protein